MVTIYYQNGRSIKILFIMKILYLNIETEVKGILQSKNIFSVFTIIVCVEYLIFNGNDILLK